MGKKVRFGDLVRASGRPEVVTLWTKPNQNRSFMEAVKSNRVLTIIRGEGHKRDFGQVGFHQRDNALYLVFPRPLDGSENDQIIGVNYDLLEQPPAGGGKPATRNKRRKKNEELSRPVQREFEVTVRRSATQTSEVRLTAPDEKAAQEKALEMVKKQPFEPVTEQDEVIGVK